MDIAASRIRVLALFSLVALVGIAEAQQKPLTIDAIYDPDARVDFSGRSFGDVTWIDDRTFVHARPVPSTGDDPRRVREWFKVDSATGRSSPMFDAARIENAFAALPGVTREEAAEVARTGDLTMNAAHTAAIATIAEDLYYVNFEDGRSVRLTVAQGHEEEATFSPNGQFVAFVRANNLYIVDIASQRERAITTDGADDLLNGKLDWVYQEEIYGRGRFRAYWWSPDSTRLAFLQINERPVPKYTVTDHIPYRPRLETDGYPKAGDPNPTVKLATARVAGGSPEWADLSKYAPTEFLIVDVDWSPDSSHVAFQVQDREQTWLDLNLASPSTGEVRTVLRETTKAWVNNLGSPVWLKDGTFLWLSERSGFKHLYHYKTDGAQVRQVTNGPWEIRTFYGVEASSGSIYFSAAERSPTGVDIYRARLDGTGLTRVSQSPGTHRATFNPSFSHYVDSWSDINTPSQVRLHKADGSEARVLDANAVKALADYRLSKPEFLQVTTRDGFVMEAMMIKPPDFNPSRRYPVFQHTYAGPGAQQVVNRWGGQAFMFHQLLAQHGFIVWVVDNRSASGKGVESQWPIYQRLGELELRDLEDGLAWLKQQPYVDPSRIILEGWSYGGFMTSYALTHSTSFAGGIVGAPVTDWRNYDSIYTERYMKMPQNNPEGYAATAPARNAEKVRGRMLLLHGLTDDNVHVQNSVQLAYELQKAGVPFEMMYYARSRHGFTDARLTKHLRQTMFEFILRTAGQAAAAAPTASR
jgi:dipeptidyl-peptidase-4